MTIRSAITNLLSALTLVRNMGAKIKPKDSVLVVADPVFNLKDERAQLASPIRSAEKEKEYNIKLMQAIEESGGPTFNQLPETGILAENLAKYVWRQLSGSYGPQGRQI